MSRLPIHNNRRKSYAYLQLIYFNNADGWYRRQVDWFIGASKQQLTAMEALAQKDFMRP
jgi:hypothetical protein